MLFQSLSLRKVLVEVKNPANISISDNEYTKDELYRVLKDMRVNGQKFLIPCTTGVVSKRLLCLAGSHILEAAIRLKWQSIKIVNSSYSIENEIFNLIYHKSLNSKSIYSFFDYKKNDDSSIILTWKIPDLSNNIKLWCNIRKILNDAPIASKYDIFNYSINLSFPQKDNSEVVFSTKKIQDIPLINDFCYLSETELIEKFSTILSSIKNKNLLNGNKKVKIF